MEFWQQAVLIPVVVAVDGLGTPQHTPGPDGPAVGAILQQTTSTELTTSGQQVATNWLALLDTGATAVDAFGYVRIDGITYEVDGEPNPVSGPDGLHHVEARLRKVR